MRIKDVVRIVPAFALLPTKIDNDWIWWKRYFLIQVKIKGRSYDGDPIEYWKTNYKTISLIESSIYNLYGIDTKKYSEIIRTISLTKYYSKILLKYYRKSKNNKKEKYEIRRLYECFYLILKYLR